jgi:hypothetical protein
VKVEAKVEMFTMVRASELFPLRQPIKVSQAKQEYQMLYPWGLYRYRIFFIFCCAYSKEIILDKALAPGWDYLVVYN